MSVIEDCHHRHRLSLSRSRSGSAHPRRGLPRSVVLRKDNWWVQPLVTGLGLFAFVVYATWAAFRNGNYFVGLDQGRNYLSPLLLALPGRQLPLRGALGADHTVELDGHARRS